MVPITGRASSVLYALRYVSKTKYKGERGGDRTKTDLSNLPQGNNIVHILHVHHDNLYFSFPHFNLLRVARRCFSFSVSDDLFFSS